MNQSSLSWRIQCIVILIILLLHGSMLVTLFIAQMQQENARHEAIVMVDPDEFLHEQKKTELDWVAVHDALPVAPVPAQPAPMAELPKQAKLDPIPAMTLDALPNLAQAGAAQKESSQQKIDQALELAQQVLEQDDKPAASDPEPNKQEVAQSEPEPVVKEVAVAKPMPGTSIEIVQEKPVPAKIEKKVIAKASPQEPAQQLAELTHSSAPQLGKKNLSLAQLTQGFVGHLEQAAMAVHSNKSGAATAEQLKQLHFCQKIISCVVNSYKIQRHSAPHNREMGATRIQLVLNENGSIHTLKLHQSSGNPSIDKFLIDMFQDASSSFPPVPASFNQKTYALPLFNVDRLEAFQSSQGWYIDNKIS